MDSIRQTQIMPTIQLWKLPIAFCLTVKALDCRKFLVNEKELATQSGGWVNQTMDPGLYIMDVTMNPGKNG
ncbi:MAG: hypothetical protein R2877_04510 [Bdellovibrionota bacterium]